MSYMLYCHNVLCSSRESSNTWRNLIGDLIWNLKSEITSTTTKLKRQSRESAPTMRFARIRKTKYYVLLILIVTVSILLTLSRLKRDTIDWLQELEKLTNQVVALLTLDTWLDRKGVLNNEEYLPAKVETYIINNAKKLGWYKDDSARRSKVCVCSIL